MNDVRKGPGDLPGDSSNPNSPDYVEPAFGLDDAAGNVARHLWNEDEVGEIVYALAEAAAALRSIDCSDMPSWKQDAIGVLHRHAARMARLREAEYEKLNNDNRQTGEEE